MKVKVALTAFVLALFISGCASTSTSEGTGEYFDDSILTAKVKTAILRTPTLKVAEINVETFKGVVQLSGFVSSEEAIDKAISVAKGIKGVRSVSSGMVVKTDAN
jgi:hyperosmotically inducible protein